jgi:hypothetical protein
MAVWNRLDEKYLPELPSDNPFIGKMEGRNYRSAQMWNPNALKEVWDLYKNPDVSNTDKIVLGSTFDMVIVKRENLTELITAFREFDGETSLKEQADEIESLLKTDTDFIAIAWNQTSVNGDTWTNFGGYDDDKDEEISYNILTGTDHWDLFDDKS